MNHFLFFCTLSLLPLLGLSQTSLQHSHLQIPSFRSLSSTSSLDDETYTFQTDNNWHINNLTTLQIANTTIPVNTSFTFINNTYQHILVPTNIREQIIQAIKIADPKIQSCSDRGYQFECRYDFNFDAIPVINVVYQDKQWAMPVDLYAKDGGREYSGSIFFSLQETDQDFITIGLPTTYNAVQDSSDPENYKIILYYPSPASHTLRTILIIILSVLGMIGVGLCIWCCVRKSKHSRNSNIDETPFTQF